MPGITSVEIMDENKRILLIDDEEVITFGFSRVLGGPGVVVDCAQSADEARILIDTNSYAAAVVDLRLSNSTDLEGLELINHLKAKQAKCRIIMLTAYGDDDIRTRAIVKGADLFFEKPIDPEQIRDALKIMHVLEDPVPQESRIVKKVTEGLKSEISPQT
jgi:DNA-binding response OmpR family regulator